MLSQIKFDVVDLLLRDALAHLPRVVVFAELVRRGSLRAAAAALGLSPSTVSHHLKSLEEALSVRLVERTSRSMTLTAAGKVFMSEADAMLDAWRRGASAARLHADVPVGTLVVTSPDLIAERFVVPAAQRLLADHPQVDFDLRVAAANLDLLGEGIDVAVRMGPLSDSGLGARRLYRDQLQLYAHPELAARWPATTPADLALAPRVHYAVRPLAPEMVGPQGRRARLTGRTRAWASSGATHISMVVAGLGFGLLPTKLVEQERAAGQLVPLLPEWRVGHTDLYAVTPSPRPTDVKVVLFIDLLADQVGSDS